MYLDPPFLKTVQANIDGRDFVVGDLHGCFDELGFLLRHVKFNPLSDRLFSTGDLLDRGPKSTECISLLNKQWFYPVLGNHEDLILAKIKLVEENNTSSLTSEEISYVKQFMKYKNQIFELPLVYEVEHLLHGKIYIVHAEILPEHLNTFDEDDLGHLEYTRYFDAMQKFDFSTTIQNFFANNVEQIIDYKLKQKMLWSRKNVSSFYKSNKENIEKSDFSFLDNNSFSSIYKIFCGHNIVPFPMKIGQQYYIDTGAALGHSSKDINSNLFSQFGHEFFTLSLVDMATGNCYGYVTSGDKKGKIFKLEKSLYINE